MLQSLLKRKTIWNFYKRKGKISQNAESFKGFKAHKSFFQIQLEQDGNMAVLVTRNYIPFPFLQYHSSSRDVENFLEIGAKIEPKKLGSFFEKLV